jgi:hypothetical protein
LKCVFGVCFKIWNFVIKVYENVDEDEEQMREEEKE